MKTSVFPLLVVVVVFAIPAAAAERHMMQPTVPADKLVEARALRSPLSNSPEAIEQGKAVYNGKGTCFTCHGVDGDGKGPAGAKLNPAPRNGSPGTGMVGFGQVLSDEEIGALIQYERTFSGRHGPGMRGHRGGKGPSDGMDGMQGTGHRGRRGGKDE